MPREAATRRRRKSDEFAYCFVTLPTCGHCGSTNIATRGGSHMQDDGTRLQRAECDDCGKPTKIIWEAYPENG